MSTEKERFLSSLTFCALGNLPAVPAQPDFVDDKSSPEYAEEQAQWHADVEAARLRRAERVKAFIPGTVLRLRSGQHYLVGDGWSCAECDTEPDAEEVTHIAYLYDSPAPAYVQNVSSMYHCVNDLGLTFGPFEVLPLGGNLAVRAAKSADLKRSMSKGYLVRAFPCKANSSGYTTVAEDADRE